MDKPNINLKTTGGDGTVKISQPLTGLLSRKQVAKILGTCTHTVARNKALVPLKFNERLVRYRAEDVQRLIQQAMTK
jgi:hypothetical protein